MKPLIFLFAVVSCFFLLLAPAAQATCPVVSSVVVQQQFVAPVSYGHVQSFQAVHCVQPVVVQKQVVTRAVVVQPVIQKQVVVQKQVVQKVRVQQVRVRQRSRALRFCH